MHFLVALIRQKPNSNSKKNTNYHSILADEDRSVIWRLGTLKFMGKEYDGIHRTVCNRRKRYHNRSNRESKTKEHAEQILK
jgi:peroxiredoxin